MKRLPRMQSPGLIAPEVWNSAMDIIESNWILRFIGGTLIRAKGVTLGLPPTSPETYRPPLFPTLETEGEGESVTYNIRFKYGTIANQEPPGMTPSEGYLLENVTGNGVALAKVVVDPESSFMSVESVEIITGPSAPANTESTGYCIIAAWETTEEGVVTVLDAVGGSLGYRYCQPNHEFWRL